MSAAASSPVPARPPAPPARSRARRLLAWLRPLVGLAILALVVRTLPFEDQLEWAPSEGDPVSVEGEIEGEWKSDAIVFRAASGALAPGFPAELRARLERGEPVALERGATHGPGELLWKPGMPRAFSDLEGAGLAKGMACFSAAMVVVTVRWWRLLALAGCVTSLANVLRLNLLGLFFNQVVPGLTGGDVVKAVLVVRENRGRGAAALVSVAVDRIIGLLTLVALAAAVILAAGDTFGFLRGWVLLMLGLGVGGALVYTNGPLRRAVRFEALLARLPLADKLRLLDQAVVLYARHPFEVALATGLSLANHALFVGGVVFIGLAFGLTLASVGLRDYFVIVPTANVVSALPLAPGGWGLGELLYKELFEGIGASGALGVAISATSRLCFTALGLLGGLYLLVPGARSELRQLEPEPEPASSDRAEAV